MQRSVECAEEISSIGLSTTIEGKRLMKWSAAQSTKMVVAIVFSTLVAAVARPSFAIQPMGLVWGAPELIDVGIEGTYELYPSAALVGGKPIVAYVKLEPSGQWSLKFAERQNGAWDTSTIFGGTQSIFPVSADVAIDNNNNVFVGTSIYHNAGRDARIYSRQGSNWQLEFEDLNTQVGALRLTTVNGSVIGTYLDNATIARSNDIGIVEQSGSGWLATDPHVDINLGISFTSIAAIGGKPMILLSQDAFSEPTYLGQKNSGGQWNFQFAPPRTFARIAAWQDRPAIVGSTNNNGPHELYFDYMDSQGVWQTEQIVVNTELRDFDFAVVNGVPVVSYVNAESSPDLGLYVAMRSASGVWQTQKVANTNPIGLYGTRILAQNGRLGIVYWQSSDNTLRMIMQVPEPASSALLAVAIVAVPFICRRSRGSMIE
jgi:hypothetical protein